LCISPVAVARSSSGGVAIPGRSVASDVYECLVRFVVDLLLNKSTTNRQEIEQVEPELKAIKSER